VIEAMTRRKGEMSLYTDDADDGMAKLVFRIPTRALLGYPAGIFCFSLLYQSSRIPRMDKER
jgi:predicted membrane GTPase involved in stress response